MKHLEYKGYIGSIEFSAEDKLLYGKVLGINSLISYEGKTGIALERNFKAAIDEYLDDFKESDMIPEKPFKGSLNLRIPSDLHLKLVKIANENDISINQLITQSLKEQLQMN
jgi:predicted HicB family RNase H-like nuclease